MIDRDGNMLAEWRKVTKNHPGKAYARTWVLVALEDGRVATGWIPDKEQWVPGGEWLSNSGTKITHWMPYPPHPDGES